MLLAASDGGGGGAVLGNLLFFALIGGAMYMLVIRPQRARARKVAEAQSALEPGTEVILTSGIYGTITRVEQDRIGLEIAPGVRVDVARAAVARVVDPVTSTDEPAAPDTPLP